MALILVTPAAAAPVTLAQAKAHLRIDQSEDEDLVAALVLAAADMVEGATGRALALQTWRLDCGGFPACDGPILLDKPPVTAVTAVQYIDSAGVLQTMDPAGYQLLAEAGPRAVKAELRPAWGTAWPATRDDANAVRVTFTCGYAALPPGLAAAVLLHLGDLYANREGSGVVKIEANPTVDRLLGQFRSAFLGG